MSSHLLRVPAPKRSPAACCSLTLTLAWYPCLDNLLRVLTRSQISDLRGFLSPGAEHKNTFKIIKKPHGRRKPKTSLSQTRLEGRSREKYSRRLDKAETGEREKAYVGSAAFVHLWGTPSIFCGSENTGEANEQSSWLSLLLRTW